jgi:hypothetical protein
MMMRASVSTVKDIARSFARVLRMVFARRCILVPYRKNREMQKGREGRVKEKY